MSKLKVTFITCLVVVLVIALLLIPACKPTAEPEVIVETVVETVTETVIETVTETVEVEVEAEQMEIKGTIPYIVNNMAFTLMQTYVKGVEDVCKANGYLTYHLDSALDGTTMIQQMEAVLEKDPAALMISPADVFAMEPLVEKYREAGVPVIVLDIGYTGPINAMVITSNYDMGVMIADYVNDTLEAQGFDKPFRVGIADLLPQYVEAEKRAIGFRDRIAEKNYDIEIAVDFVQQFYGADAGYDTMQQILDIDSDLDLVYYCSGREAVGGANAIVAAGKDPLTETLVIGYDGAPEEWQAIMDGILWGTFFQVTYDIAVKGTEIAIEILEDGATYEEEVVNMPGLMIDQSNVMEMKEQVEAARGIPVIY